MVRLLRSPCFSSASGFIRLWRRLRERRLDARHLQHFNDLAQAALRNAEVDRLKSGTTWAGKRKFRIVEKRVENKCGDICSFYLQPHDGGELPPFLPGQFLTFELPISDQPAPVIRCYSLSDSPSRLDRYRVTIKRLSPPPDAGETVPGGLSSTYFHANLKEGDVVDVQAPKGGFVLDLQSERPVVLIGGGVGLTPVLSMLKALDDAGSHREVHFFHAARSGDDIVLCDEFGRLPSGGTTSITACSTAHRLMLALRDGITIARAS